MKKLLLILAVACVLGVLCANLFNRFVHPDIRFFQEASMASDRWSEELSLQERDGRLYIFSGGSEARFGVDPAILLKEYGIPSINAGMTAGYGLRPNLLMALRYARPGDVVIGCISFRPYAGESAEGIRAAFYRTGIQAFTSPMLSFSPEAAKALFKSSSSDINSYVARRLLTPHNVYKYYQKTVLHESGWGEIQYTDAQRAESQPLPADIRRIELTPPREYLDFLRDLKTALEEKGVELWVWYHPDKQHSSWRVPRAYEILELVKLGCKVLRDDTFNVIDRGELFSDRIFHVSALGAGMNTRKLGQLIRKPDFWTEESLTAWLYVHGWDAQGNRIRQPE